MSRRTDDTCSGSSHGQESQPLFHDGVVHEGGSWQCNRQECKGETRYTQSLPSGQGRAEGQRAEVGKGIPHLGNGSCHQPRFFYVWSWGSPQPHSLLHSQSLWNQSPGTPMLAPAGSVPSPLAPWVTVMSHILHGLWDPSHFTALVLCPYLSENAQGTYGCHAPWGSKNRCPAVEEGVQDREVS